MRTRRDRDVGIIESTEERLEVTEVGCQVGVHEHDGVAGRREGTGPHGRTLSAVLLQSQHLTAREARERLQGDVARCVVAAVVDDDDLRATALDELDERFQGRADPMLLAVRRYHHAERCHGPRPPMVSVGADPRASDGV